MYGIPLTEATHSFSKYYVFGIVKFEKNGSVRNRSIRVPFPDAALRISHDPRAWCDFVCARRKILPIAAIIKVALSYQS